MKWKETMDTTNTNTPITSRRGFAAMDPARQRRIASQGGKAAHENGTAHHWNSQEAAEAGRRSHINRKPKVAA